MAAAGTKKWAKFPRFVEYANARERFQEKTPANMQWAQDLSLPLLGKSGGSLGPLEEAWHVLGAHQAAFQEF
jgi:hypothetical protein